MVQGQPPMRIGSLAERTGIRRETIRYYEKRGLLGSPTRSPGNGYRLFGPDTLRRLSMIRFAKGLGFTLTEIAAHIDAWACGSLSSEQRAELLAAKMRQVEVMQQSLATTAAALDQQWRQHSAR